MYNHMQCTLKIAEFFNVTVVLIENWKVIRGEVVRKNVWLFKLCINRV